jgi:hypothetical protein
LAKFAIEFVDHAADHAVSPPPEISPFESDGIQTRLAISKLHYQNLVNGKTPFFYHQTHYESGQYMVWNSTLKKFVVIASR